MFTVSELLLPSEADLAKRIKDTLADEGIGLTGGGLESLPALGWGMMPSALARQLAGLLDIGLGDILVGAWNSAHGLRQQIEKSAKTPGKELFLQLAEHKITSTHKPYIGLLKDGREIARLPFAVSLELVLQGAVVRILDGAIQEIQTGKIKGKGTVKCGGAILVQKELQPIVIPGTLQVPAKPAAGWLSARVAQRAS
jgi:hypothetical protein